MNVITVNHVRQVFKISYGLLFVVVGLDKITGLQLITNWDKYVAPLVTDTLDLSSGTVLIIWGFIELVVGLVILTKARAGAWLGIIGLLLIILNLLAMGDAYLDIVARDAMLGLGLYALARLSEK